MKRRNFFAVLCAALLARKLPVQGAIGSAKANEIGENLRQLTEAMRLYAPAGWKSEPYRYAISDPRPLDALGRRIRSAQ